MTDVVASDVPPRADAETPEQLLRSVVDLSRRWTSAGVKGKGIRLADHELDLLNALGLGDVLMSAAAAEQKNRAIERRSLRGGAIHASYVEGRLRDADTIDTGPTTDDAARV